MTTTARLRVLTAARDRIASHHDPKLELALIDLDAALDGFTDACRRMQDAQGDRKPAVAPAAKYAADEEPF